MSAVKPTRQELLRLLSRIKIAEKGHKLLKDKRDGLIKQFLTIVKESLDLRKTVDGGLIEAIQMFQLAESWASKEQLQDIAQLSKARVLLGYEKKNVMGVTIPLLHSDIAGDPFCYGVMETNRDLDASLLTLRTLLPDLIRLAELEFAARRLAEEIEKTRRRVNGLEYVIIPQMKQDVRMIRAKLEENARQEKVTLMKIKDKVTTATA